MNLSETSTSDCPNLQFHGFSEDAWAVDNGRRLQGIVDGTTAAVPDSEVRKRFGL